MAKTWEDERRLLVPYARQLPTKFCIVVDGVQGRHRNWWTSQDLFPQGILVSFFACPRGIQDLTTNTSQRYSAVTMPPKWPKVNTNRKSLSKRTFLATSSALSPGAA